MASSQTVVPQQACGVPGVWCPVWTSQPYDGPAHGTDSPGNSFSTRIMATSSDGKLVFLAGTSDQSSSSSSATDYQVVTIAYDTSTGNTVWIAPFTAPSGFQSYAEAIAVRGSRVFVRITASGSAPSMSLVMAYDAATGAPLWSAPSQFSDDFSYTHAMAAVPDGSRVYVTGGQVVSLSPGNNRIDALAIALDGATGNQLWVASVPGSEGSPPSRNANGFGIAATANRVFMAVAQNDSQGFIQELDLLVVDAATGQTISTGSHANMHADDQAGLAVAPDGSRAFIEIQDLITDTSGTAHNVMGIVAFDANTGQYLWSSDYFGPNSTSPVPGGSIPWMWGPIVPSPDGTRLFAAAESSDGEFGAAGTGFTTVAYDTSSGAQLWAAALNTTTPVQYLFVGPVVTVDPAGRAVYVVGPAAEATTFAVVAYDPSTGSALKTSVYSGGVSEANGIAISPDGSRLFVGASSASSVNTSTNSTNPDIVALAYDTGLVPLPTVVSQMSHGSAGVFNVELPMSGTPGIECRSGGATGNYTLVFKFANTLTSVGGASVTSGTGSVTSSNIDSSDAHNYIVNLTGVTDAQVITVSLGNVNDSAGNSSSILSASMGVVIGDTNGDGFVNSADISQTKSQSGQAVTSSNFREDVNADGFLNSADISLVKSTSGTALP